MKTETLLPDWTLWPSRLLLAATVLFISQQMLTNNPVSVSISVWDKLSHFVAWGLVVTLGYYSCRSQRHFITIAITVFVYSTLVEILQPILAQRFFSFGDIVANGLGCLTAMLLVPIVDQWLYQKLCNVKS